MIELYQPHRDQEEYEPTDYLRPAAVEEIQIFTQDNSDYSLQDCLHETDDCLYCIYTTSCRASPNFEEC